MGSVEIPQFDYLSSPLADKNINSISDYLNTVGQLGVQVKNDYTVEFSDLEGINFYCTSISLPNIKHNTTEIAFNGFNIAIPTIIEYVREFTMTFINDAHGFFYSKLSEMVVNNASAQKVRTNSTITVTQQCGSSPDVTKIKLYGVRIQSVSPLSFGQDDNNISTFDVTGNLVNFKILKDPGKN